MTEKDICDLIAADEKMMKVLEAVRELDLPDYWIGAGFIRNRVWDHLHEFKEKTETDVDVLYVDKANLDEQQDRKIEQKLKNRMPDVDWQVKNQARMHYYNQLKPFQDVTDSISKWPETATSVAIRLDKNNKLILIVPYGIDDMINLRIVPTPFFRKNKRLHQVYEKRQAEKNWPAHWPKLKIVNLIINKKN